uniref:Uncharacterized protein n=1 Tax=Sphaerodactylus townsendi TaxID=933632 RepID=A0ACB8FRU4_9SAUR
MPAPLCNRWSRFHSPQRGMVTREASLSSRKRSQLVKPAERELPRSPRLNAGRFSPHHHITSLDLLLPWCQLNGGHVQKAPLAPKSHKRLRSRIPDPRPSPWKGSLWRGSSPNKEPQARATVLTKFGEKSSLSPLCRHGEQGSGSPLPGQ